MPSLSRRQLLGAISTSLLALASAGKSKKDFDVLDYVDPLIGTSNGGMLVLYASQLHIHTNSAQDTSSQELPCLMVRNS